MENVWWIIHVNEPSHVDESCGWVKWMSYVTHTSGWVNKYVMIKKFTYLFISMDESCEWVNWMSHVTHTSGWVNKYVMIKKFSYLFISINIYKYVYHDTSTWRVDESCEHIQIFITIFIYLFESCECVLIFIDLFIICTLYLLFESCDTFTWLKYVSWYIKTHSHDSNR